MNYEVIFDILNAERVRSSQDVQKLKIGGSWTFDRLGRPEWTLSFVSSSDYPWVKDIYLLIRHEFDRILKKHESLCPEAIVAGEPYDSFLFHTWDATDPIFTVRAKLACLFPGKMLFVTAKFVFNEDDGTYWIPIDFLIQMLEMSPVIKGGYAFVLPKRLRIEREHSFMNENDKSGYYYFEEQKFITIPGSGSGMKELTKQNSNLEGPAKFILNLPWLMTKETRHCVDLMEKYPTEFALYSSAVTKALSASDPDKLERWIADVATCSREMDVIYKNKMKELKAKGWETLAGILPSLLAFALPDSAVKQVLAPLVAAKTAVDGARWFYDMRQAKNLISKEKNWIIWRMKH